MSRLTLPVMLMVSLAILLIGRADENFADRARSALNDFLAPAYALIGAPIDALEHGGGVVGGLFALQSQNAALRADNARLLQWQAVALALQSQNDAMRAALNYTPPAPPRFFTGNVVADLGGVYARSVLVALPPGNPSPVGAVALDGSGVAGRVVEAGSRSARVLLITDLNSRIPVAIGGAGAPALLVGTNDPDPQLLYWSPGQPPAEGAAVLTSATGGAFPAGLPVGTVHYNAQNDPVVVPFAQLDALRLLRLFSYPVVTPTLTPVPPPPPAPKHKA